MADGAARVAQAIMSAHHPSLTERLGNAIYDAAKALGYGGQSQVMRNEAETAAGFVPVLGDALTADDAVRDYQSGNYGSALANLGLAALGVMPGVGDLASKAGKGLRGRYYWQLFNAAGGKDPMRIKLTPERVEAAKQALQDSIDTWNRYHDPANRMPYQPLQDAQTFANHMARQGENVRFKIPDATGKGSSFYVRVGDNGTVRFSDHLQPEVAGQTVGGYSKELGRRHQPAQYSVAPGEMTLDDVLRIYGK